MGWVRPKMQWEETSYDSRTMVIAFTMVMGLRCRSGKRWSRTFIEGRNLSSVGDFYSAKDRDSDTIEPINLYMYIDSESNFNNDDYFATTIPDHKNAARGTIMDTLMKSKKWDQMMTIEDGQLVFLAAGVDEYTKHDTEFRELIVLGINWTDGLMGRGTEILSLLFKNKMAAGRFKKSHRPKWTNHGCNGVP